MVDYIDAHRQEFGVESICNELPIAPSTYQESVTFRGRVDEMGMMIVCLLVSVCGLSFVG